MNLKGLKHIYALDNGNGNIMAYRIDMRIDGDVLSSIEPIMDELAEPAGYTLSYDGKMQLGKQLTAIEYGFFKSSKVFPVNFKSIPSDDNRTVMINYLKGWLQRMKKNCPSIEADGQDALWMIGCPNGWDKAAMKAYKEMFIEAGYVNPIIVKESNAAMKHLIMNNAQLKEDLIKGIMCIDCGAYSNDGTFVLPKKVQSTGNFVGANLIEKMIVMANLQRADTYRKAKRAHNDEEVTQLVYDKMMKDKVFESFLILQARWLKEQYFNNKAENNVTEKDIKVSFYLDEEDPDFDENDSFVFFINTYMINDLIYKQSIKSVLGEKLFSELSQEVQDEIQNKTWEQCFCDFLECLANEFPTFKQQAMNEGKEKALVVVTGGASKMDVIENCIYKTYPNVKIEKDLTPILSIAKGLIEFAPDKINALTLYQAVEDLVNEEIVDEDGDKQPILIYKIRELYLSLVKDILMNLNNTILDSINKGIKQWLDYNIDSTDISSVAWKEFDNNFEKYMQNEFSQQCNNLEKDFIQFIDERFRDLLTGSKISNPHLFNENETLELDFYEIMQSKFIDVVKDDIKDDLNRLNEHFFSQFNNNGRIKGILFSSRSDFFTYNYDTIIECLQVCLDNVFERYSDLFIDDTVYKSYIENHFNSLSEKIILKKEQLLGELIVEENYED